MFCGCSDLNFLSLTNDAKFFAVATDSTAFYYYGPRQAKGPDRTLPKDTIVMLIRSSWGVCKVKLTTGEEGYVASDDIRPAPPALLAASNTLRSESSRATRSPLDSTDSRPAVPPEPVLDLLIEPTPIPNSPESGN